MKLKSFLPCVTQRFAEVKQSYEVALAEHILEVKNAKEYNDLATRIAWDVFRAAFPSKQRVEFYDSLPEERTDAQLTTLFKAALKESGIYAML